jgi:hypothetical protein
MKRSVVKNPSYYKKKSSGFFASLGMTEKWNPVQKLVDTFNGRVNNALRWNMGWRKRFFVACVLR